MTSLAGEEKLIKRATLANLTATAIVLAGLGYFIATRDSESLKWLVGFGIGWLFKEIKK